MGLYDGKQTIIENTFEIAKLCAQAAHKSSQITGRVEIKSMIVTGEDMVPILEVMEAFAQVMPPAGGGRHVHAARLRPGAGPYPAVDRRRPEDLERGL